MAKPRLEKVRALFYIISVYYKKRDCVYFDTAPFAYRACTLEVFHFVSVQEPRV